MRFFERIKYNIRLIVQVIFTTITNSNFAGFINGTIYQGKSKIMCVPGLNCYSCPGALGSCPIGSLQAVLNSRNYSFSFYISGIMISFGAVFGRLICGWLCPFGLVQDLLHKIPFFKKIKEVPFDKYLKKLKYLILGLFVIILPLTVVNIAGGGDPWFCKYICPSGTLLGGIPLIIANSGLRSAAGSLFLWKVFLLLVTIYLSIKIFRPFCRYICPLGAIYSFFNPIALYRYELDEKACIDCGACAKTCPMDIKTYEEPNSLECIRCGKCKDICPTSAITSTFERKNRGNLKVNESEK